MTDEMGKVKNDRFRISADELEHRMELKKKLSDDPIRKGVEILTAALYIVLSELGVDVSNEDTIAQQQIDLGITVWDHNTEDNPQLNGFFVHVGGEEYIPYAWVGAARLNQLGECYCDIQRFQDETLLEVGGVRLVQ